MSLSFLTIISTIFFGILTVIFSLKEEKTKKLLKEREEKQKHKLYELSILKEIQDRIGYELDIEKIIDVITNSLPNLFSYSAVSSMIVKENKLIFKINIHEEVNQVFIEKVKQSMLASLEALINPLPEQKEEYISGLPLNPVNTLPPSSFFHIPLIVSNNVIGIITISSTKTGLYKEAPMTILYQITNQASNALTRLQSVLTTEKGKLVSLITSLDDGVFMLDTNDKLLVINNTAKNLLSLQKEKPTVLDVVSALPSEYNFADKIQKAISQNIKIEEKEVAIGNKIIQVFITPVLSNTKVIGASILLHDITLEKNLSQMKEDFTNIIVHELRAPLTAIRGASKLLLSEEDSEEQMERQQRHKLMAVIHDQAQKLLEDVSSLLDAAKLEAGRLTIQKSPTDLKKLIEEKVQFFLPQTKSKEIILASEISSPLPLLNIDPLRIGQVLNNLISNSLKFTPRNGKITIMAMVEPEPNNNFVKVSVSDTGIGIPKEKQDKLFSKFSQLPYANSLVKEMTQTENGRNNSQSAGLGTGLGLYITKGIVESHNGSVFVESEADKGTTFSFTIPISS